MPYYDKQKFLEASINSILAQTYTEFEIILVNDQQNLEAKTLLKIISNNDSRIKLINNDKNLGAGESRNKAIDYARGDFIAFCDCDDIWKPSKLETQLNFMEKFNLNFSFTAYEIIDEDNNLIGSRNAKTSINFDQLKKSCDIGLSTVIIKKKVFDNKILRFGSIKTKEDFVLWLRIAQNNIELKGLNINLSSWRKSSNSLSSSLIQKLIDGYKVYRVYLKYSRIKSLFYLVILSINFILKR